MSVPIVRLITRLNIGGPARQALLLSRALRPDFDTTLAAGTPPPDEGELSDPEVPVRRVPLVRALHPVTDVRALISLRRLLSEQRPALVHTHMAKAGAIGRAAALSIRPRPKVVHTFHGHVLEGYFRATSRRAFIAIERRLARATDALVAVSEEVREELLDLGIGSRDRFRVIPLGFDLSSFVSVEGPSGTLRSRLGMGLEVPLVGVLGRLAPIKDHATLLGAIARLPDVHLAVLGDGEERARLRAQADALGIAPRVHFLGWVLDSASAIADMDVVALSSRNEGTPVSLIEALACGRPVVSTDIGGVRSVVKEGVSGYLVPKGDDEALAAALYKLLSDDAGRAAMGRSGREHVRSRFDQTRLVSDIRALYEEVLEG